MAFAFGRKYVEYLSAAEDGGQPSNQGAEEGPNATIPFDVSGEVSQYLQRLTKREGVTKAKSLQGLAGYFGDESSAKEAISVLPYWSFVFPRLLLDGHRGVRLETVRAMSSIAQSAGRQLAPFLGGLLGPWLLAGSDESRDVRAAAQSSLEALFPKDKKRKAILHCWKQVLAFLGKMTGSSPESLGDSKIESKEELQERHTLCLQECCGALCMLLELSDASKSVYSDMCHLATVPSFLKSATQHMEPAVRRAAYHLLAAMAQSCAGLLSPENIAAATPHALVIIREKSGDCHADMWAALLSWLKAYPESLQLVDVDKKVLPSFWSFLRHACYGSGDASYPAVLPFITLLNSDEADVAKAKSRWAKALSCLWQGLPNVNKPGWEVGCEAFCECFDRMARPVQSGEEQQFQGLEAKELLDTTVLPGLPENPNAVALLVKLLQYNGRYQQGMGSIKSVIAKAIGKRLLQVAIIGEEEQQQQRNELSCPNDSQSKDVWRALDECITSVEAALPAQEFQAHIVKPLLAHFASQDMRAPQASLLNAKLLATHSTTSVEKSQAMDAIVDSFLDNPTGDGVAHAAELLARLALHSQENPELFEDICRNLLAVGSSASESLLVNTVNQLSFSQNSRFSMELELDSAPLKVVLALLGAESGHCLVQPAAACDFLAEQFQVNGRKSKDLAGCCQPVIESLLEKDEGFVASSGMRLLSSFAAWYMKSLRSEDAPQKSRIDMAWSQLWISTSSALNSPAAMVFARLEPKDQQALTVAIGEGLSAYAEAWSTNEGHGATTLNNSVLDDLLVNLTPPMTIICQSAPCYTLLFNPLIALILNDDGFKAAAIAAELLAHFIGRSATKAACLEVLKADQALMVLIQVLSLVQPTTLRSRVLETIMGEKDMATRLVVAAAVGDDRKLLADLLLADQVVAHDSTGQPIFQSMFEEAATALLERRGKQEKTGTDDDDEPASSSSSLKALRTLGTVLCTPGMPHEERMSLRLPAILNAAAEHIQSSSASDTALWLEAALACCPPPGTSTLAPLLLNGSTRPSSERPPHRFSKGDAVWYWLAQGDWVEAQVEAVEVSVDPPSYGIMLRGGYRETEASRLAIRVNSQQQPPPLHPVAQRGGLAWPGLVPGEAEALEKIWQAHVHEANDVPGSSLAHGLETTHDQQLDEELAVRVLGYCDADSSAWKEAHVRVRASLQTLCLELSHILEEVAHVLAEEANRAAGSLDAFSSSDASATLSFLETLRHDATLARSKSIASVLAKCDTAAKHAAAVVLNSLEQHRAPCLVHAAAIVMVARKTDGTGSSSSLAATETLVLGTLVGAVLCMLGGDGALVVEAGLGEDGMHLLRLTCDNAVDAQGSDDALQAAERAPRAAGLHLRDCLLALVLTEGAPWELVLLSAGMLLRAPRLLCTLVAEDVEESGAEDARLLLVQAGLPPALVNALASNGDGSDDIRFLIAWALLLAHLDALPADDAGRAQLAGYLYELSSLTDKLFSAVVGHLTLENETSASGKKQSASTLPQAEGANRSLAQRVLGQLCDPPSTELAGTIYAGALSTLPASSRLWFAAQSDRGLINAVDRYTSATASLPLLANEFAKLDALRQKSTSGHDNFSIRCNVATRQALAVMEIEDGRSMELLIKLPADYPLSPAEVSCQNKVGVSEARLRKWLLSVTSFLRRQEGSVAHAISLWRENLDREFEGQEECLICYSILHPSTGHLPKLACRTCRKKFHGACLYKWFRSSGKSTCPHCQSTW